MAFDLSNPLAGLAWDMVNRAKTAQEKAKTQYDYERDLINKRLNPYGGDISEYQSDWERAYGPQSKLGQAQSQAYADYWTGLPELMMAAAKEGTATASAGGTTRTQPTYATTPIEEILKKLGIGYSTVTGRSADAAEAAALASQRSLANRNTQQSQLNRLTGVRARRGGM